MSEELAITTNPHEEFVPETIDTTAPPNPLKKINQYLRGRYLWAALTGAVLGACAAGAGYHLTPLTYSSTALIRINPALQPLMYKTADNEILPMYDIFLESQVQLLSSQRILLKAYETPEWQAKNVNPKMSALEFDDAVDIVHPQNSEYIKVRFRDRLPERAPVAAKAILEAYSSVYDEFNNNDAPGRMRALEARRTQLKNELDNTNEKIVQFAREFGGAGDLMKMLSAKQDALIKYQQGLQEAQILLAFAKSVSNQPTTMPSADKPISIGDVTMEMAEKIDPDIQTLMVQRGEAQRSIDLAREHGLAINHPAVKDNVTLVRYLTAQIDARVASAKERIAKLGVSAAAPAAVGHDGVSLLEQASRNVAQLTELVHAAEKDVKEIANQQEGIDKLRVDAHLKEQWLDEVKTQIDHVNLEANASQQRLSISDPDFPLRPDKDRRMAAAGAGGFGGFALGVGIFALIGFLDRRLKTVDDARDSLDRSKRILGILPYLPEDLSDPEQAGTAAFCVHHIRTLLQIGGQGTSHTVMAVTSPAPGDGKTSLVISLGLSYAASGAKTLLIDSDLIGAGLTTRVNSIVRRKIGAILLREKRISEKQLAEALDIAQKQGKRLGEVLTSLGYVQAADLEHALSMQRETSLGLLDVLDGEPMSECLINGWAPNLSVLPMGNVGASHAGQISLRAVRRIMSEARANFDVVLIDTGPILGSLEACIFAAAVDEVIVTVARGQQRPLVEKTFSRLREIGAHIAGIVFNRAASEDVERGGYSGSATSQRYHSPGAIEEVNGAARMRRLGPVAWAVAGEGNAPHDAGGSL
jgi:Mrp family chromosome partitioning ATPase/uncharacterized protein involved in exopolysaccharide biosynthesis